MQLGKCYFRLGMFREAEQQLKSALKQQEMVDTFLHLCRVYVRLDEPLKAIESFTKVWMPASCKSYPEIYCLSMLPYC